MTQFAQPLLSLLVGIALAAYGAVHAATHVPASSQLHVFWSAMPSFGSVLLFLVGVLAVAGGISLLVCGLNGLKRRRDQIGRIYGRQQEPFEDEEEGRAAYYR